MGRNARTSRHDCVPEEAVVHAWLNRLARGAEFTTLTGDHVRVTDPGCLNPHDGPDFLHAVIQRNGMLERGAIEVHSRTRDWKRHGHENHEGYRKVVLHVAMRDDGGFGEGLPPTIILANERVHQYDRESGLPCGTLAGDSPASVVEATLMLAAAERFRELCERFTQDEALHPGDDASDRLWRGLLRCLGFGGNTPLWVQFAESHSAHEWKVLASLPYQERVTQLSQWFRAGSWVGVSKGIRPGNRPEARMGWLLVMMPRILGTDAISRLRDDIKDGAIEGQDSIQEFLGSPEAGLGAFRMQEMVMNAIAPWAWTEGYREGDWALQAGGAALFFRYGKDPGYSSLRTWRQVPRVVQQPAAWPSQAMLWMEKRLCASRQCSKCLVDALRNE